ncbi:Ycf48-like protein [compost metagenome]
MFNGANLEASLYRGAAEEPGKWQLVSKFRGGRPYARDMHFLSADKGFVALTPGAGPIEGGLMTTDSGGKDWSNAPIEDIVGVTRISFADERLGWVLAEANRERHVLLRTRDGGESWERISFPAEVFGR